MKTYLGGARRLHLTALVMGSLLYGSAANAANLVSTIPSDYGNSEMGTVTGSRVTTHVDAAPQPGVLKNLNRDPASFGYHQQGKSKVFLRQYTYSVTDLEGNLIIDPNSAGAAATIASGKIKAVPNTHAAAGSDSHIYVTGYDLGQIGVAHQNGNKLIEDTKATVNLKADIKKYCGYNFNETFQNLDEGRTYTGDPERALVHGEALFIEGRKLYVAVSVNPLAGYEPYDDGFLMQYDIQDDGSLKFGSYTRISRNIDQGRLNKFNDQILVSCIGGYQHYDGTGNRHHTAINIAKLDESGKLKETTQRRVVLPEHVKDTGQDMRDLKILPNGTAYVMTYNLSPSGSQIDAHVYQTTVSNLLSNAPEDWNEILTVENEEGWFGKLNAEYYTKRLWLELGDTLRAYTDGDATEKYKWIAKDFSDNKAFSRFNKITMLEPDWVSGTTASVILAAPAAENSAAVWQGGTAETNPVTASTTYTGDTVIRLGKDLIGNKATNVLAGIYAASGDVHINAAGHTLWLQTENTVGNPTGIYAGKGKNVIVDADAVNIITRGLVGGNTLTNAIQLDAAKNKAAKITINAPVNISMTGGLGGNGVAIQKSDRLGEKSYEASQTTQILLNGALKIAGARTDAWGIPINRENVFSRFNNAGILTQVEKSNITVRGPVDMTVYGNGVTTNANGSSVHLGGGSIQVPSGMKYSYYALAAYQGAIHMNTGADGMTPGTERVVLNGDLFALPTGTLSVALTTANARLHGLVDNGGTANLYLQNGAQWVNEARNMRYYQDSEDIGAGTLTGAGASASYTGKSRITNFHGGMTAEKRGVIFQKNTQPLMIDNYSGHTRVLYAHDAATPTTMKGGDLVITRAAAGSAITLTTDSAGLNTTSTKATDKNRVSAALDALAKKLYYTAYKTNERNLIGKTEIAEGLTASSATRRIENITFNNATGQGGYAYTPATDPKPPQPKPDKPKPPQPKPDKPKPDNPKPDNPKPDNPKPDNPKPDNPKPDNPKPPTPQPEYGDYETKLMRGVKSAMTAAAMTWRAEANDLMKRMGDLRLSPGDLGAWARVYRGRSTGDKDNTDFRMNYTTIQVGYDWRAGKDWRIGLAGSYMKGSPNFASGSGDAKEGNLGIYGTWTGKSGQYVDIIAKVGRLENNYTVYNDFGHYVKGDYHTWGSSISAEYGKRITARSGSYIEPQVEFIYSHLNGANYTGSTDYMLGGAYQNMYIRQGAYNSFVGRIGLGFGQETQRATYYAKVSLYHEFAGDLRTDYSDGVNPWKHTRQDGNDTWVGVQLGGTVKLSDKTNLYGSFEKTFGGDIKTAWRMDAGLRWSF